MSFLCDADQKKDWFRFDPRFLFPLHVPFPAHRDAAAHTLEADRQGAAGTQSGSVLKKLSEGRWQLGCAPQWYPSMKRLLEKSRRDTVNETLLPWEGEADPRMLWMLCTCPRPSTAPQPKSQITMGWKSQVLSNNFSSSLCSGFFVSVLLPKLCFPPLRQKLLDI